jgi:hypothetical protein
VNDALGANVHPGAGCHLPVHGYSHRMQVVEGLCILEVRDYLAIGDNSRGTVLPPLREEPVRMARVHVQALSLVHLLQKAQCNVELSPI